MKDEQKRILVAQLEISATHMKHGYVLAFVDVPIDTLFRLVPELREKRLSMARMGFDTEVYVSFKVAIYDTDCYDDSTMYIEIDECGGCAE